MTDRDFSDKARCSIPAPSCGALTVAREVPSKYPLPLLDVAYCSHQLAFQRTQISQWLAHEHSELCLVTDSLKREGKQYKEYFSLRVCDIENEAGCQEKDALAIYGMLEGTDPHVAPLRCASAVWGLTADDIGVLSIHGTSTGANVSFLLLLTQLILTSALGGK